MSLRKLNSLILLATLVFAAVSCKDDDEDTTLPSLDGLLQLNVPEFVTPGQTVTMKPRGLEHPDGENIGYYWKVTPTMTSYDTTRYENGLNYWNEESDGSFTFKFTDTLQTCTVYCYGFAEGYSSSSASYTTTVVKGGPDGSLQGVDIFADTPYVTVDGVKHYYVRHGGLEWFRTNLADTDSGIPFRNSEAMSDVFGRFYNYEDALTACPEGWRLPTEADWISLGKEISGAEDLEMYAPIPDVAAKMMANATFNGDILWEYWPEVGTITNDSFMTMIPVGFANLGQETGGTYPGAIFDGVYEYAAFWTADAVEDEPGMAYYRYLTYDQPFMSVGKGDAGSFGASVRCVRDVM